MFAAALFKNDQNPAGGMDWNEATVIKSLSGPPNNWDVAMIRHNVLDKYRVDQIQGQLQQIEDALRELGEEA